MRFTDRQIKNLKPRDPRYEVFESPGFGVRVSPTERKTFIYYYRIPGDPKVAIARRLYVGFPPQPPGSFILLGPQRQKVVTSPPISLWCMKGLPFSSGSPKISNGIME
jgi:hypothetical protein